MALTLDRLMAPHDWPATVWVLVLTTLVGVLARVAWRPAMPKNAPALFKAADWPVLGALQFWSNRHEFNAHGQQQSRNKNFSFYVGKYRVVSVGLEGRKWFFESKDLNMNDGYATLLAASPAQTGADEDPETRFEKWFARTIIAMMRKEKFDKNLPLMVHDCQTALRRTFERVGEGGLMDPFDDIYRIVYQLTMRMVGPHEFAESDEMLDKTLSWFGIIEWSVSPIRVIFPWLPTPGSIMQLFYGARLYGAINGVIEKRKKTGRRIDDTLQYLMDTNESTVKILTFIIGSLFAGQLNSGINAGWLMVYLAADPMWYKKFQQEVDGVIEKYRTSPDQSPLDILATFNVEEWESEFPLIDLGLRESIRLQLVGAAMRKNISGKDLAINQQGEVCPKDGYAVFQCDNIHMDPEIYPNPSKWDPGRYLPDRAEDKKRPYAYMGWGYGRHVCLGMRFAKLEMGVIAACFISMFDFSLTNVDGQPMAEPYPTNRGRTSAHKPERPMRLKIIARKP